MKISPARQAAFNALRSVESSAETSSNALARVEEGLRSQDKALCHRIVLGVLRNQLLLDHQIGKLTGSKKLDLAVRISLRIGLFQILFLNRVPDHSAINESVELVHKAGKTSAKGLVNAVLRRASAAPRTERAYAEFIEVSHPQWLLDRWRKAFGADRAIAIARANNSDSRTAFRLIDQDDTGLLSGIEGITRSAIAPHGFVAERMSEDLRNLSANGKILFQEEASQLVGSAVRLSTGEAFLDVCAAPGNKTTQAAGSGDKTGLLVAGDNSAKRIERLRQNTVRFSRSRVEIVRYDAASDPLPFAEGTFDKVLVDAPCSGTGTIASNPEIRYRIEPSDIIRLQGEQRAILRNASKMVKSGGTLYYATCSLEPEENEAIAVEFLDENPFRSDTSALDDQFLTREGFFRTFPDTHGVDGFFLAVFTREGRMNENA